MKVLPLHIVRRQPHILLDVKSGFSEKKVMLPLLNSIVHREVLSPQSSCASCLSYARIMMQLLRCLRGNSMSSTPIQSQGIARVRHNLVSSVHRWPLMRKIDCGVEEIRLCLLNHLDYVRLLSPTNATTLSSCSFPDSDT